MNPATTSDELLEIYSRIGDSKTTRLDFAMKSREDMFIELFEARGYFLHHGSSIIHLFGRTEVLVRH